MALVPLCKSAWRGTSCTIIILGQMTWEGWSPPRPVFLGPHTIWDQAWRPSGSSWCFWQGRETFPASAGARPSTPCSVPAPAPRQCGGALGEGQWRHGPGSAAHMHAGREVLAKPTDTQAQSQLDGQTERSVRAGPAGARQVLAVPQAGVSEVGLPHGAASAPWPGPSWPGRVWDSRASRSEGLGDTTGFPWKARRAQPYGRSPRPEANPRRTQPKPVRGPEEAREASA